LNDQINTGSTQAQVIPPPWALDGDGYIFAYRFDRAWAAEAGFIPPHLAGRLRFGLGTVMLVNYRASGVGPYRELLFIPGLFDDAGRRAFSITRIYVSTEASVVSGRANWGIPKLLADFTWERVDARTEQVRATTSEGETFFEARLSVRRWPALPFNTGWLPAQPALIQRGNAGERLLTRPGGRGRLQLARIESLRIDGRCFPDVGAFRPLLALRASNFRLVFPVAETV
jgi:hypothetical protein